MKPLPAHFSGISVRNFRGFKKAVGIRLAPLTFLVGPNSSGKSSLFDAILLLIQSGFAMPRFSAVAPTWIGQLVDLGSFEDAVFEHRNSLAIGVELELPSNSFHWDPKGYPVQRGYKHPFRIGFEIRSAGSDPVGRLNEIRMIDVRTGEQARIRYPRSSRHGVELLALGRKRPIRLSGLHYELGRELRQLVPQQKRSLPGVNAAWNRIVKFIESGGLGGLAVGTERVSSGRSAPQRWYPSTGSRPVHHFREEGRVFGEVSPALLEDAERSERFFKFRRHPRQDAGTLASHLRSIGIASSIQHAHLSAYHSAIRVRDSVTGVTSNLIDVGYGASQVIPVIHACLSHSSSPLFVEQPEIHLHPKAQADIGELLCRTSQWRQVIVETHSVHVINRARILVARGDLDPSRVVVNYVARGKSGSHIVEIPILRDGEFGAEWPEGFFEERYQDTLELLELKQGRGE